VTAAAPAALDLDHVVRRNTVLLAGTRAVGRLVDRVGRTPALAAGLLVMGVGAAVLVAAPAPWILRRGPASAAA
jgi:hypothetical protein